MTRIEEIIPQKKIIKSGKNYRIGIDDLTKKVNLEKFDTTGEDSAN